MLNWRMIKEERLNCTGLGRQGRRRNNGEIINTKKLSKVVWKSTYYCRFFHINTCKKNLGSMFLSVPEIATSSNVVLAFLRHGGE